MPETKYTFTSEGAEKVVQNVHEIGDAHKTAAEKVGDLHKAGIEASEGGLAAVEKASELARDRVKEMAHELGSAGQILSAIGPGGIAAAAGIGLLVEIGKELITSFAGAELAMTKVSAVIKATGDQSGKTAEQIEVMADRISTTTLAAKSDVLAAAAVLETFGGVSGDVFDRTLKLAGDLAATGFGDLGSSAQKLGRLLEDPINNLNALKRIGIEFDPVQKATIKNFEETGQHAQAVALILDTITHKVGGVGDAAGSTLIGSWHSLTESLEQGVEAFAKYSVPGEALKAYFQDLGIAVRAATDELKNHNEVLLHSLEDQVSATERVAQGSGMQANAARAHLAVLKERIKALEEVVEAERHEKEATEEAAKKAGEKADADHRAAEAAAVHAAELKKQTQIFNELQKQFDPYGAAAAEAAKEIKAINTLMEAGSITNEQAKKDIEGVTEALQKQNDKIAKESVPAWQQEIDKLNDHLIVLQTENGKRGALSETLRIEFELRERLGRQYLEHKSALDAVAEAVGTETEKQKDLAKALAATEKAARDQAKAIAEFSQKTSDEIIKSFFDMAAGAKSPFDNLKAYAIKTFEEIAAAAIIRPIIQPIIADAIGSVTGVTGASGASGNLLNTAGSAASLYQLGTGSSLISGGLGAGLATWINNLGASVGLGGGTIAGSSLGYGITGGGSAGVLPGFSVTAGGTSLTSVLGGAGLGALGGGLIASLTGGNKTFDTVAGAGIGGAYAAGAIGGPVALGLAAVATLLGALFGGHPSVRNEGFTGNLDSGALAQIGGAQGSAKFSQDNLSSAQVFAQAVTSLVSGLTSLTGGRLAAPGGNTFGINVNNKAVDFGLGTTGAAQEFPDIASAWKYAAAEIVKDMTDMPAEFQAALKQVDLSSQSGVTSALNQLSFIKSFLDLQKQLAETGQPTSQIAATFKAAHDQVAALVTQVEALGVSAAEVNKTLSDFDNAFRANELKDLQSTFNQASGQGYLNTIQTALDTRATSKRTTAATGLSTDLVDKIFGAQLQGALGGLSADQLSTVAAYFGQVPEVIAAVTTALAALKASQNGLLSSSSLVSSLFDQRISDLDAEATALQNTAAAWGKISASLAQFSSGLVIDPSLSPLSLGQQDTEAFRQLQDAYTKAKSGDPEAAAQFQNLAKIFLTIDKQYNASSAAYAQNFSAVQSMASQLGTYAGSQVSVANQQLAVLTQIRDAVTGQRAAVTGTPAAKTYGAADVNALGAGYIAALQGSGKSEAAFLGSTAGQGWITARNTLIGQLTDPALINQFLQGGIGLSKTPGLESFGQDEIAVAMAQLTKTGAPIPKFATGGPVTQTGLAYVHAGEHVSTPGDMQALLAEVRGLRNEVAALRAGTMTAHERTIAEMQAVVDNTGRTAAAPYTAAALGATSRRSRMLGPVP